MAWLGQRLGYARPEDWYQVTARDIRNNYGGGLLARFRSYKDLLKECIPDLEWNRGKRGSYEAGLSSGIRSRRSRK
jgi:hypothetical protein